MEARLSPQPAAPASRNDMIDAAIDRALADNRIVGAVVLVADKGQLVYERATGLADREAGRPVRLDTPFRFASVTKPFTVMTAMKLVEQGRLSPDDPVSRYLPEFRPAVADGAAAPITVAHLMAHTSGLDYRFNQPSGGLYARAGISDGLDQAQGTLADNIARIASVPLGFTPGSQWRYSVGHRCARRRHRGRLRPAAGSCGDHAGLRAPWPRRPVSLAGRRPCCSLP